jgi:hypothetical protein
VASLHLGTVLSALPDDLRAPLIATYAEIRRNFAERRWEPSELNAGKLSEAVFRVLEWYSSPTDDYTPLGVSLRNFGTSVRKFENQGHLPDSVRFHIPNALVFLYTIRNKRGVGHLGGDVNPNRMDAEAVLSTSTWVVAELIRIFHAVPVASAQALVEELVGKRTQLVWEIGTIKRVLVPALSHEDRVLALLYSEYPQPVEVRVLYEWAEHSHSTRFRNQVLRGLHKAKLVEYDEKQNLVHLSPIGIRRVEESLQKHEAVL